jgi:hypothetical protein
MFHILAKGEDSSDIRRFWLRKSKLLKGFTLFILLKEEWLTINYFNFVAKKPVLAVLAVKNSDGTLKLYRGTNMEVSMPTGSLCAERNGMLIGEPVLSTV